MVFSLRATIAILSVGAFTVSASNCEKFWNSEERKFEVDCVEPTPPPKTGEEIIKQDERIKAAETQATETRESIEAATKKADQDSFDRSRVTTAEGSVGGGFKSAVNKGPKTEGGLPGGSGSDEGGSGSDENIISGVTSSFTAWRFPFLISSFYVLGAIEG